MCPSMVLLLSLTGLIQIDTRLAGSAVRLPSGFACFPLATQREENDDYPHIILRSLLASNTTYNNNT